MSSAHFSVDNIQSALQPGILNEAQAAWFISHHQTRLGYRDIMSKNDEHFEFFKGFTENFITTGLGLLTSGMIGLTALFGWATNLAVVLCVLLARCYSFVRRIYLPSIALSIGTAACTGILLATMLLSDQTYDDVSVLAISGAGMILMLCYFYLFKLPFAMFLFGLYCMVFFYGVAIDGAKWLYLDPKFPVSLVDIGQGSNVAVTSLSCGLTMMAAGLWFDIKDPHRISRHSVTGLSLHILTAPALVNIVAMAFYYVSDTTGYLQTTILLCIVIIFAIIIDRQSFLNTGIFFFAATLIWAAMGSFSHQLCGFMVVALLGAFFTTIGTWWVQVRATAMHKLPNFRGKSRLPPYV